MKMKSKRFTDIAVMNWVQIFDYFFQEIDHERIFIHAAGDYIYAELIFHHVEYMSCPTYLGFNFRWRVAPPDEAERVFEAYILSDVDRERARRECTVYCIDENLNVYRPRPQRTPYTFYIVAHRVEIVVYWGDYLDDPGLPQQFQ